VNLLRFHDLHRSVVVAVIAVGMVKMAIDQIVDVVAVGHRFVSAARTVYVARVVSFATMPLGAFIGICVGHG